MNAQERWDAERDRREMRGEPTLAETNLPDAEPDDELARIVLMRARELTEAHPLHGDGKTRLERLLEANQLLDDAIARLEDWLDAVGWPAREDLDDEWLEWDDYRKERT